MDQVAQAIQAVNRPQVVITQLGDGNIAVEFKNGIMPPALLFAAAGAITRAANKILDESEHANASVLESLPRDLRRT